VSRGKEHPGKNANENGQLEKEGGGACRPDRGTGEGQTVIGGVLGRDILKRSQSCGGLRGPGSEPEKAKNEGHRFNVDGITKRCWKRPLPQDVQLEKKFEGGGGTQRLSLPEGKLVKKKLKGQNPGSCQKESRPAHWANFKIGSENRPVTEFKSCYVYGGPEQRSGQGVTG